MHENRHFLSDRKRRHDAENHVHICALRQRSFCFIFGLLAISFQLVSLPD